MTVIDEETKENEEEKEDAEPLDEIKEEREVERKEETDDEIVEERIYTIPLGRAWISPRKKRAPKATRLVKSFIQRHMKPEVLRVSNEVNERIWRRGIEKPPRKIRVRAAKDKEGIVTLYLAEGD
jgi:large subunit ribosomal protein L31e